MLTTEEGVKLVEAIVLQQMEVIGPLAITQARKAHGITVSDQGRVTLIEKSLSMGDVLVNVVHLYERIFGKTSVELCRDAIRETKISLTATDLPEILQ